MNRCRAAVWFAIAVLTVSCGGGDGGDDSPDATPRPVTGLLPGGTSVEVGVPPGWGFSDSDGHLIVAKEPGDLDWKRIPTGPRIVVGAAADPLGEPEDGSGEILVAEDPSEVTIGGYRGVSVALQETIGQESVTRRYLTLYADGSTAELVLLEAPTDQWQETRRELETLADTTLRLVPAAPSDSPTTTSVAPTTTAVPSVSLPTNWQVALDDSFETNVNDWEVGDQTSDGFVGSGNLGGGAYRIAVESEASRKYNSFTGIELSGDYLVTVDAVRLEGPNDTRCGLVVAAANGYPRIGLFVGDLEGEVRLQRRNEAGGQDEQLIAMTSPHVRAEGINRLAILRDGSSLYLFVNDESVAEASGGDLSDIEHLGMSTRSPGGDASATCEFDNLIAEVP